MDAVFCHSEAIYQWLGVCLPMSMSTSMSMTTPTSRGGFSREPDFQSETNLPALAGSHLAICGVAGSAAINPMNLKRSIWKLCSDLAIAGLLFNSLAFPAPQLSQGNVKPVAPRENSKAGKKPLIFALCVATEAQEKKAGVLIDSIRRFGGPYSQAPIYVVVDERANLSCTSLKERGVQLLSLDMDEAARDYPFAHKVYASAQVEERVASSAGSLAWFDVQTLVVAPPRALELDSRHAIAMRPVFLLNTVGQPVDQPVDAFWSAIYRETGVDPAQVPSVESFVEAKRIRHYINCGIISFRPDRGICRAWARAFTALVRDAGFQRAACADRLHKIFLHQAVLSSVILVKSKRAEWRWLPRDHGYPLNLHDRLAPARKARSLNELSCLIYDSLWDEQPGWMNRISIGEPLRTWVENAYRSLFSPDMNKFPPVFVFPATRPCA